MFVLSENNKLSKVLKDKIFAHNTWSIKVQVFWVIIFCVLVYQLL